MKCLKKIYHTNTNQKKAGMVTLISDKVDFRAKKITIDKREKLHADKRVIS